jgi:hypothetical protein
MRRATDTVDGVERGPVYTYELIGPLRWVPQVSFAILFGVGVLAVFQIVVEWDPAVAAFLGVWSVVMALGARAEFRMPRRIETDDRGMTFVAPLRRCEVPWSAIQSVRSAGSRNGGDLVWRWDGGKIAMHASFTRLPELVEAVERRCPDAVVRVDWAKHLGRRTTTPPW